jgi:hypothetical protein
MAKGYLWILTVGSISRVEIKSRMVWDHAPWIQNLRSGSHLWNGTMVSLICAVPARINGANILFYPRMVRNGGALHLQWRVRRSEIPRCPQGLIPTLVAAVWGKIIANPIRGTAHRRRSWRRQVTRRRILGEAKPPTRKSMVTRCATVDGA